jgi:hypothetical protein
MGLLTFIGYSGSHDAPAPAWRPLFQNDSAGHPLYGDKQTLLRAVKQGCPIRVAWGEKLPDGTKDIEYATPDFTSLVNDSDLVVQFPASMIQTDYMHASTAFLKTDPPTTWRALMSTDGHYHQFHQDLASGAVTRIMFLRASICWYALTNFKDFGPAPDMAIPNGIILDSIVRKP